jgi:hypothetical protein
VVLQKDLSSKDYSGLMMDELEDLHMTRLRALENIEKNKLRVAKYYNKKVKVRQFAERDLVWKALLPIGTKYSAFGKWSPNWEWPFWVVRFLFDNPAAQDYKGVGSRRPGERSESMLQSFFFLCFFSSSLFNCSRTTVTPTWKLWG